MTVYGIVCVCDSVWGYGYVTPCMGLCVCVCVSVTMGLCMGMYDCVWIYV